MVGLGVPAQLSGGRLRATRPTTMGDPQVVDQREVEYRTQSTGADCLVVAGKLGNASGAKGAGCPGQPNWANHLEWEELVKSARSRARGMTRPTVQGRTPSSRNCEG